MRKKRQGYQRKHRATSGWIIEGTNSCIRDSGCYLQGMKRKKNTKLMPYNSKQYDCLWDNNFESSSNV
jgi:hypothetical protein